METPIDTPALPTKYTENFYNHVYRTVMGLWRGKSNNIGTFKFPAGATEVQVSDTRVTKNSHISVIGLDNNSVAGVLYIKERNQTEHYFVVGSPASETERAFSYAVTG